MQARARSGYAVSKLIVAVFAMALVVGAVSLTGCNTTEGVGRDIKAAGRGIENTAQDAKN